MPQNIFALVIEIRHAAGLSLPDGIPVIALCDFENSQNWVSRGLVEYLSSKITGAPTHHPQLDHGLVKIRWNCERLKQYDQEGSFLVEAKAKFKIVFGCGHMKRGGHIISTSRSFPSSNSTRLFQSRRSKTDPFLSNEVTRAFHEGVKSGTLLRLKQVPSVILNQTLCDSVEELEKSLEFVSTSNNLVEQALTISDGQTLDEHMAELTNLIPTFPPVVAHSSGDSDTTELSEYTLLSTNTSLSTGSPQIKQIPRLSLLGRHPDVSLSGPEAQGDPLYDWQNQSTFDDPARWFCSQIPESKYENSSRSASSAKGSATPRTATLDETAQLVLEEAGIVADHETSLYWTWDKDAHRYKHFDEGCEEPVWYCPPVT
ncbi:hypothetical protein GLAREA_09667 [Glarea lozoyensis ATCC 20868]|uniref:Uncharacterized protein n=1 Tax=Glarea lozoyensis (strain ATCC 20868 / MF5171) TaxID=1116229 RepID=S3D969_GLAL2|nr:uncharacterized protein GLAREA_09667 [Glarea lozoyensis ATCC 20868]EPE28546.1 hypothetical protein GLAREA_09667 [Glarea lozoyensis ATCC 20868]